MKENYYSIPADRLGVDAKLPLRLRGDSGEVFYDLALR